MARIFINDFCPYVENHGMLLAARRPGRSRHVEEGIIMSLHRRRMSERVTVAGGLLALLRAERMAA